MNHRYHSMVVSGTAPIAVARPPRSVLPAIAVIGGALALVFVVLPWLNDTSPKRAWQDVQDEMKREADEAAAKAAAA